MKSKNRSRIRGKKAQIENFLFDWWNVCKNKLHATLSHFVFRSQFPTRCIFAILFVFTTRVMLSLIKLHSVYFASAFFVLFIFIQHFYCERLFNDGETLNLPISLGRQFVKCRSRFLLNRFSCLNFIWSYIKHTYVFENENGIISFN